MEEFLRALLMEAPDVADLVGTRVDWGGGRQGSGYPSIVLTQVGGAQGKTLVGRDGLEQGRVQVDCYGVSFSEAKSVSRAVIQTLDAHRNENMRGIFHVSTRDGREVAKGASDEIFRVSMDFLTKWRN